MPLDVASAVRAAIADQIAALFDHPWFRQIQGCTLTTPQLSRFSQQYTIASREFPRILCRASASIQTDTTRAALIENLWDEHGRGDLSKSHRALLDRFVIACNLAPEELSQDIATPETRLYLDGMSALCTGDDELVVLGAIGPGCEEFTPRQYKLLATCLERTLDRSSLEFFFEHISHDGAHIGDIYNSIIPICTTEEAIARVCFGAKQALLLETMFWNGIHRVVNEG
jgi:pyrroloquinoline quinone (PQQ) biosynthesis protein C